MRDFASKTKRIWSSPLILLKESDFPPTGDEITTSRSDALDGYHCFLWHVLTAPYSLLCVSNVAKIFGRIDLGWTKALAGALLKIIEPVSVVARSQFCLVVIIFETHSVQDRWLCLFSVEESTL